MLDTTNAKAFNSSLKKALNEKLGVKCSVSIINSYKFPNCWVQITPLNRCDYKFPNEFRKSVFDANGFDENTLLNKEDISYGNIQSHMISAYVKIWSKIFE